MPAYLEPAWVAAWADAVEADAPALVQAARGATLSVSVVVADGDEAGPGGLVAYHLRVRPDGVDAGPGRAEGSDLTFRQDRDTATRIGRGELDASAAFLHGLLRVDGDVRLLVRHQELFAALDTAMADLRAATDW